jgi:hypothetical protein
MQTTERRATQRGLSSRGRGQVKRTGRWRAHEHDRALLHVVVVGVVDANLWDSALESSSPRATRRRLRTPRPVLVLTPST